MLPIKTIRADAEKIRTALKNRNSDYDLQKLLDLDDGRREILAELEALRNRKNTVSKEVGRLKKEGLDASHIFQEMKEVGQRTTELETELAKIDPLVTDLLEGLPNIPAETTPVGKDASDNPTVRTWGEPKKYSFEPLPHWDIGENLGIMDFERAAKITGARFVVLKGAGSKLERSLIQFMLDTHTDHHGYTEMWPPFMTNSRAMRGTGQLPKFEQDLFKLRDTDYYLVPTAEVPVTNYHMGDVLDEADLTVKYCAYTPCFRAEAGAAGRDTRGMIRQHQFDKVELVKFAHPDKSFEELESLTADAEQILKRLELPYRTVALCTGDLGFSSAKTYDIEVWLPSQNEYREISSCSNFLDFQARRADIRYKPKSGKGTELVHTLNGSGLAVGRTLLAILENNQQADGSVIVPEALRPYMRMDVIKRK